jgi:hypothetical protein
MLEMDWPLKIPSANFDKSPVGRKERLELLCLGVRNVQF